MDDAAAVLLARDLRRGIGALVRAVRQGAGTPRSAQSEALDLLQRLGPMNVAALAGRRGVTHQTMRVVIAQLTAAGLVRRDADPADRRSRLLSISPAGREALGREQDRRSSWIEDAIRTRLTREEQDALRAAVPIIGRLAAPPD